MKEFVEKLIERLKKTSFYAQTSGLKQEKFIHAETAIQIVKDLASEHNNGWIPCEKELPEECKTVLGCDKDGYCELVYFYKCSFLGEHWRVHRGGYRPLENIIAWQPIPEPFKKGE